MQSAKLAALRLFRPWTLKAQLSPPASLALEFGDPRHSQTCTAYFTALKVCAAFFSLHPRALISNFEGTATLKTFEGMASRNQNGPNASAGAGPSRGGEWGASERELFLIKDARVLSETNFGLGPSVES